MLKIMCFSVCFSTCKNHTVFWTFWSSKMDFSDFDQKMQKWACLLKQTILTTLQNPEICKFRIEILNSPKTAFYTIEWVLWILMHFFWRKHVIICTVRMEIWVVYRNTTAKLEFASIVEISGSTLEASGLELFCRTLVASDSTLHASGGLCELSGALWKFFTCLWQN